MKKKIQIWDPPRKDHKHQSSYDEKIGNSSVHRNNPRKISSQVFARERTESHIF